MAEAAAAVGVTAATLQFFDFSLKTLVLCKQIRDSEKGTTEANQELEASIGKFMQIIDDLQQNVALRVVDRPITTARNDCVAVMSDLQKLLNDFKLQSRNRNLAALKVAFRAMKGKREIEKLQNRLSDAQRRLTASISVATQKDIAQLLEEQAMTSDAIHHAILPQLQNAHAASASGHAKTHRELLGIGTTSTAAHNKTQGLLKEAQECHKALCKEHKTMAATLSRDIAAVEAQTEKHSISILRTSKHKELLDSLHYLEMFDRQQSIKPPSFDTFEWIFESSLPEEYTRFDGKLPPTSSRTKMRGVFARWLVSNESLFWISGKAGSGKSSLMSLIQDDARTAKALSSWSQGRYVYTFSFYFWRPGTTLQKSIHGLLRSLLYQLVKAKPAIAELIVSVNPALYNDWTTKSLLAALRCSLSAFRDERVFLMVDGLDEYEGQYAELLDLFLDCRHMTYIKVCLASRPETLILAKLKEYPHLRLQDLNTPDIEAFVKGRLSPLGPCIPKSLTRDIIIRADGVFLWAALITKSMESGALAGDDAETLHTRLESTPVELNALFEQLLSNVDKVHYETLSMCLFHLNDAIWTESSQSSRTRPRVPKPSFRTLIGLITASMPTSKSINTGKDFLASCLETSERIVAQCKGLIEVHSEPLDNLSSHWVFDFSARKLCTADANAVSTCCGRVEFVHRSAYDFIFGNESQNKGRHLQAMIQCDVDGLVQRTLVGMKLLLHHAPITHDAFWMGVHSLGAIVFDGVKLADRAGADPLLWLDDLRSHLSIWFPSERLSKTSIVACTVDDGEDWTAETLFWKISAEVDGYMDSRWDHLMQSPYVSIICSEMLFYHYGSFPWEIPAILLLRIEKLLAASSDVPSRSAAAVVGHVLQQVGYSLGMISWNGKGNPSAMAAHFMANLAKVAYLLIGLSKTPESDILHQGVFALLRRCNAYIGNFLESESEPWAPSLLQIQTDCIFRQQPQHFGMRLLCLAHKHPSLVKRIEATDGGPIKFDADVVSLFNVRIGSLNALQSDIPHDLLESPFPKFQGTRDEYLVCLEQLLSAVRADDERQLDAWQQLYMLACIKKDFKRFWAIVEPTPETRWLARITI